MSVVDDLLSLGSEAPAVVSGLVKVVRAVGPVLPTVRLVVEDPAFAQVIARIRTLHEIEASKPSKPGTPGTPAPGAPVGIGLNKAVPILDAVIFARRNPWIAWAIGAGVILGIGGVGYKLGKRSVASAR